MYSIDPQSVIEVYIEHSRLCAETCFLFGFEWIESIYGFHHTILAINLISCTRFLSLPTAFIVLHTVVGVLYKAESNASPSINCKCRRREDLLCRCWAQFFFNFFLRVVGILFFKRICIEKLHAALRNPLYVLIKFIKEIKFSIRL